MPVNEVASGKPCHAQASPQLAKSQHYNGFNSDEDVPVEDNLPLVIDVISCESSHADETAANQDYSLGHVPATTITNNKAGMIFSAEMETDSTIDFHFTTSEKRIHDQRLLSTNPRSSSRYSKGTSVMNTHFHQKPATGNHAAAAKHMTEDSFMTGVTMGLPQDILVADAARNTDPKMRDAESYEEESLENKSVADAEVVTEIIAEGQETFEEDNMYSARHTPADDISEKGTVYEGIEEEGSDREDTTEQDDGDDSDYDNDLAEEDDKITLHEETNTPDAIRTGTSSTDKAAGLMTETSATTELSSKQRKFSKDDGIRVIIPVKTKGTTFLATNRIASIQVQSSLESKNVLAQYHNNLGQYQINHQISSSRPFSMIQTTIKHGEHKGRVAWIADPLPATTFSFVELPPEIRNMVYDSLFVKDGCDIVFTHGDKADVPAGPVSKIMGKWVARRGYKTLHKNCKDWSIRGLNLLASCKEIRMETTSIVYGSNSFNFTMTTDAEAFLTTIGQSNRNHIRKLDLGWIIPKDAKPTAKLLLDCYRLERFTIDLGHINEYPFVSLKTPDKVVPIFRKVFKQMYAHLYGQAEDDRYAFFSKERVSWVLPAPSDGPTPAQLRELNKQMKSRILDAAESKKVDAKRLAAKKAAEKKRAALAKKKRRVVKSKPISKQRSRVEPSATIDLAPPVFSPPKTRSVTKLRRSSGIES